MPEHFISCDWGTSAFRIRLIETSSLDVIQMIDDPKLGFGKLTLTQHEYLQCFTKHCRVLCKAAGFNTIPLCIISGMASSSIGIKNLPYGKLPSPLKDIRIPFEVLKGTENITYLISGLATEEDVMRGEEVQVLGAIQETHCFNKDAIILLPGTHSKHVIIKEEQILTFQTYMTGELFSLLQSHSILRHSVENGKIHLQNTDVLKAFDQGVNQSASPLLQELFTIRARQILQHTIPARNSAFLSGLLIGNELRSLARHQSDTLILCADMPLLDLYEYAILKLFPNRELRLVSTEKATILGHYQLLQQIHSS
ncbi:2-dehydro-3-deoxygalactonokinase [Catalinimonas alkaloidigena]|uniref:2-dehydro-3-deoxygalactonokinase n=1 Tax=Catalinimonas alkaloidigena TaxID=1075417 RepID=UPI0024052573|nr:2-dehydro-3-deoxygalactonokinase [Catalinimonas alkaloidigena]MDF9797561.1 2-dehydro-3-deoxygalactonokinase [Catalinimonas alkaloidigena]